MATNSKKTALIIITSLIIAGVGGYFIYRKIKSTKEEKRKKEEEEKARIEAEKQPSGSSSGGYSAPVYTHSSYLKTKEEGDKFRNWVNDKYPAYAKEIDLARKGDLNSYVEKAWLKYGNEYKSQNDFKPSQGQQSLGSASSQTSSNVIGKNAVAKVNTYVFSTPNAMKISYYFYAIGTVSKDNKLGKIKGVRENEGIIWYEIDITIGLSDKNGVLLDPKSYIPNPKIGWVNSADITVQ